jgi:predicted DsbA family dithiol-disulfide isomerase
MQGVTTELGRLQVSVWSDIACPWCYLGKRRLEAALASFKERDAVQVTWRAFELDRQAPPKYPSTPSYAQRLADKYRFPLSRAEQMLSEMTARGAGEQIAFNFPSIASGNTFLAHQLAACARQIAAPSVQNALSERLFRAYFSEGRLMSDAETLVSLAVEVGLSDSLVRTALEAQTYAEAARADELEAAELGVTGVPFFVIGRYAVEGAQPADTLRQVLERAWRETAPEPLAIAADAQAVCTPNECK